MVLQSTPVEGDDPRVTTDESDDDEVEEDVADTGEDSPDEEEAEASQDTTPVLHPTDIGEQWFGADICRVRLSVRSNGRTLLCGCPAIECSRRRHNILRHDPDRLGLPGFYVATWNSSQTIRDAVEDTFRTAQQREQTQVDNRALMLLTAEERLQSSEQKEQTEAELRDRLPATVGFLPEMDLSPPEERAGEPPETTPRQARLTAWRAGLFPSPAGDSFQTARDGTTGTEPLQETVRAPTGNTIPGDASNSSSSAPPSGDSAPRLEEVPTRAGPVTNPTPVGGSSLRVAPPAAGRQPRVAATGPTDPALLSVLGKLMDRFEELGTAIQANQKAWQDQVERTQQARFDELGTTIETNQQALRAQMEQHQETGAGSASATTARSARIVEPLRNPGRPESTAPTRWYAVSIGRTTGVFTSWKIVRESVKGYAGATYKRFHNETSARSWLQDQWNQQKRPTAYQTPTNPDDLWEEISFDGTQVEPPLQPTEARDPESPGQPNHPLSPIVDLALIGDDPSTGKDHEIFGTSISIESDVLKLLCPKGVTDNVKRELVEAAVDVVSLPGKYNQAGAVEEGAIMMNQLSEALGDLASYQTRRAGQRPPRDTQWRIPARNALRNIKTVDELNDAADEISAQTEVVLRNMVMNFKDILFLAGWSTEASEIYCSSGILPRIVRDSLTKYHQLFVHLQSVAIKNPDKWKEVTAIRVDHHARSLGLIRQYSPTYLQLIVQVYIYLREAKAKKFKDLALLQTITEELEARMTAPPSRPATTEPTYTCAHCHGSFHEGGKRSCPLAELKVKAARRIAAEYARITPPDPSALERLIAAAQESD